MNKASFLTLLSTLASLAGTVPVQADSITLYGNSEQPPKAWLDDGTAKGFVVEAALEVLNRAGYSVDVKLLPFARAMQEVTTGGVLTGVFYSSERAKLYYYSTPLVYDEVVVVVAKGKEFPFEKAADLAGKRVGLQNGFFYGDDFASVLPNLTVDSDASPVVRMKKLSAGRIDVALINPARAAFATSIKEAGLSPDEFVVLPKPMAKLANYLIVGKQVAGGSETLARINKAIAEAETDGTLTKIMAKYSQ
jgi:polar amino acid transport system substrate-binding protein